MQALSLKDTEEISAKFQKFLKYFPRTSSKIGHIQIRFVEMLK